MARTIAFTACLALLAACASTPVPRSSTAAGDAATDAVQVAAVPAPESNRYRNRLGSAIPEVLQRAMDDAYAYSGDCAGLVAEVQALDAVLGEDIDSRSGEPERENFLAGVLVGAIKGLIPYRSWLVRLSGEDRRRRRGVAAIAAGSIRRAYLKGMGDYLACPLPGRPKRPGLASQ